MPAGIEPYLEKEKAYDGAALPTVHSRTVDSRDASEAAVLAQLGIKQELKREWSLVHSFGLSPSRQRRVLSRIRYQFLDHKLYHWHNDVVQVWLGQSEPRALSQI